MSKFIRSATVQIRIRKGDFSGYEPTTITLKGLKISFAIQKNLSWATNTGVIKIWNLSADHRNLIKDFGDQVTIYAGYERGNGESLLYIGDTTAVSHIFELPEIITVLECGDGDKYVNQKHFSLSFQAQTPLKDVITSIANQMGFDTIAEFASTNQLVYEQGKEFTGMLKDSLTAACDFCGLQWSVQNNGLQIIPKNGTITQPAYKINAQTGMVGIPQRFTYKRQDFYILGPAVGWKVNTLLDPFILPGYRVDLESRYLGFQGIFRVETVRHFGDTYGPEWQTNMELTQLPA